MNRQRITEYLESKGVKHSNKGFHYLREAIVMYEESRGKMGDIVTEIAKRNCTTQSGVERCMRYCVKKVDADLCVTEFVAVAVDRLNMQREFRICTACGRRMVKGYVIGDGAEYYCDDECLSSYYSEEEYDQLCQMDQAYWTEWE